MTTLNMGRNEGRRKMEKQAIDTITTAGGLVYLFSLYFHIVFSVQYSRLLTVGCAAFIAPPPSLPTMCRYYFSVIAVFCGGETTSLSYSQLECVEQNQLVQEQGSGPH